MAGEGYTGDPFPGALQSSGTCKKQLTAHEYCPPPQSLSPVGSDGHEDLRLSQGRGLSLTTLSLREEGLPWGQRVRG